MGRQYRGLPQGAGRAYRFRQLCDCAEGRTAGQRLSANYAVLLADLLPYYAKHDQKRYDWLMRLLVCGIMNTSLSEERKQEFMNHFRMDSPEICLFHRLKHLADFVVNEIQEDINLLKLPWKELSNALIMRAYADCERDCPEWLLSFVESVTLEDLDDEEIENLRMFFIEEINRHNKAIKVYSAEDGYPIRQNDYFTDSVKSSNDFYERVFNILNERLIPYIVLHHAQDGLDYVCFTSGLRKALLDANQTCYSLKSTAQLLGWEYKPVKIPKTTRVIIVRFDIFLKFLYPNLSEKEDS